MHFFFFFRAVVHAVLLPPAGLLILTVVGAVLLARHHRRSGWTCLITGLSLLWLLSAPMVADALTELVEVYPAFNPSQPTTAQAIVILGGTGNRDRAPEYGGRPAADLDLLERLNYGAWLSRRTQLPILVTSDGWNSWTMATSLARDFQVPPRWVDWRSYDTFGNARNSAALLRANHVNSILLVTSTTHMARAMGEFVATGLQVTAAPAEVLNPLDLSSSLMPTAEGMLRSNRAIYELIGGRVREVMAALHLRRQQPG